MNAKVFAEWFDRQGYRVVRTRSSYWVQAFSHVYQAFPYHWLVEPGEDELQNLFKKHKALSLRYSAPYNSSYGAVSYHVVYEGANYTLEELPKQSRKNIRKAMRLMAVEPISFKKLATEGWQSRAETLERQKRTKDENRNWWIRLCHSADGLQGFEAWAAIVDRKPVASLITFTCESCCSILYQQCQTKYLSTKVNNLLVYMFTKEVMKRPSTKWIFSGMHSLTAPYSLDKFKFSMRYKPKAIRQTVLVNGLIAPFLTSNSLKLLKNLMRLRSKSRVLAKSEGMIRFFLEGRRPFSEQSFPQALRDQIAQH